MTETAALTEAVTSNTAAVAMIVTVTATEMTGVKIGGVMTEGVTMNAETDTETESANGSITRATAQMSANGSAETMRLISSNTLL